MFELEATQPCSNVLPKPAVSFSTEQAVSRFRWFPRPEAPLERTEHPPRNRIPGLAHQQHTAYIHGSDLLNWSPIPPFFVAPWAQCVPLTPRFR